MRPLSNLAAVVRWALLAVALAVLNLSLTFANVWPTLRIRPTGAVSIEAAVVVLAMVAAWRWRGAPSRAALRWLGALWVVLVVGRYADVTTRSLYGRELNLYWDLRYMPDVGAMLAYVADPWLIVAVIAGALLLPLAIYVPLRWAVGRVGDATRDPWPRRVLAATSGAAVVVGVFWFAGVRVLEAIRISEPVTRVYVQQARQLAYELSGAGVRALGPARPIESNLAHVADADVFLVFVESYGAVSWDRPALVEALAASRARLEADIRHTGRRVVSAFIESTTFGGESWLAHISLLTGTEVRDQDTNVRLMGQQRDTLVTAFARQGYRTVAIMPGLQRGWPEGAFYGFDDIYDAYRLEYRGPPFGWWDITDQFALGRLDALEIARRNRPPVFVFFPTISTHTPFTPTPPYQPDWSRVLTPTPYEAEELDRAWSQPPDWLNLGPGYAQALDYLHASIGGYLRLRADRDFVIVLIGDHQPPAMVTGEGAPWDVPAHVIASRGRVLDRLLERGFREGLQPQRPVAATMHGLLPILLHAFGDD
ncbi:MAG: sulfatase-like hydrolase/transferase [Acidobacteria bacterium]|nr:sulfatase-like hydrolase/transferase [Acidobacteriota bacterium]